MAMLSPLGRGRSARPSADAVRLAPVPRSAVRRPRTATARPVSLVAGAGGPDLRSSRSGRLPWRRPRDGSCGSVPSGVSAGVPRGGGSSGGVSGGGSSGGIPGMAPMAASPGWRLCWRPQGRLLWWRLRGGVSGVASPGWRLRGGVSGGVEGRPGGRCGPGPRGLPASPVCHTGCRYPARHVALAAGNYRDVTLRWPEQRRCGIAVVAGGVRAGGGLALRPPRPLPAARRPPPAVGGTRRDRVDGTSIRLTPVRWNIDPVQATGSSGLQGPRAWQCPDYPGSTYCPRYTTVKCRDLAVYNLGVACNERFARLAARSSAILMFPLWQR
jgi:hypothetical protein